MRETITDNGVSSGARHLFHILKDFARGKNWPDCWPGKWRLAEEVGRSHRQVERYLQELERARAIEVVRTDGGRNKYRILLGVKDRLSSTCTDAPTTPMSGVPTTPMSGVPTTPMSGVGIWSIREEAINTASSAGTEVPAAAAGDKALEEEMQNAKKCLFDELVKLGMAQTEEMRCWVGLHEDLAAASLSHCRRRFSSTRKPVDSPRRYIAACFRDPGKFGLVQREGRWQDPDAAQHLPAAELSKQTATRKAASRELLARTQADAEKAYADMSAVWEKLPEEAKKEIRDFVQQSSPLFHKSGEDEVEFELQCMREAAKASRFKWLQKQLAK